MKKLSLLLILFLSISFADDIYFKNGCIIRNVGIISQLKDRMVITTTYGKTMILINPDILKIDVKPISMMYQSKIENCQNTKIEDSWNFHHKNVGTTVLRGEYKYPYLIYLPISIICFYVSYDYFKTSDDIDDGIRQLKYLNNEYDTSKLESTRLRKQILFAGWLAAGIFNAYLSTRRVQLTTTGEQITLNYIF